MFYGHTVTLVCHPRVMWCGHMTTWTWTGLTGAAPGLAPGWSPNAPARYNDPSSFSVFSKWSSHICSLSGISPAKLRCLEMSTMSCFVTCLFSFGRISSKSTGKQHTSHSSATLMCRVSPLARASDTHTHTHTHVPPPSPTNTQIHTWV